MKHSETEPLEYAVGEHTTLDGGPLIFWWLTKPRLPELVSQMGPLLADFRKRGLQIRDTPDAVTLARIARDGMGMIYDARINRTKIRPQEVDYILIEEDVQWACYVTSIGALYVMTNSRSERQNVLRALQRFAEMGVLVGKVIRQRAAVRFMGRDEFLAGLKTRWRERR